MPDIREQQRELIEKYRGYVADCGCSRFCESFGCTSIIELLNALESAHTEIDRLRGALEKVANWHPNGEPPHSYTRDDVRDIARAALKGGE